MINILTSKLGNNIINCYDGEYSKEDLKNWAKKNILLCPACEKPYEYCHGELKIPYFRHKNKFICDEKYYEPESQEHIKGKRDLFEWIRHQDGVTNVILEGWIQATKQRPDIMFEYNNSQYVIEYQCSPISTEYIERRKLYEASGIKDIWICGVEKYFQYYHKGTGAKCVNIIEDDYKMYYDSYQQCFYKTDSNMSKDILNKILNKKTYVNLMDTPKSYKEKCENFHLVKDELKSYTSYSYYPSGRRSNKYQYPVTAYRYNYNMSLANCKKLKDISISYIGGH